MNSLEQINLKISSTEIKQQKNSSVTKLKMKNQEIKLMMIKLDKHFKLVTTMEIKFQYNLAKDSLRSHSTTQYYLKQEAQF